MYHQFSMHQHHCYHSHTSYSCLDFLTVKSALIPQIAGFLYDLHGSPLTTWMISLLIMTYGCNAEYFFTLTQSPEVKKAGSVFTFVSAFCFMSLKSVFIDILSVASARPARFSSCHDSSLSTSVVFQTWEGSPDDCVTGAVSPVLCYIVASISTSLDERTTGQVFEQLL
jgi:hypothetical protein